MTICELEDELFQVWQTRYPGFVKDGVVDRDAYLSSGVKILYLLKEVSDQEGGWDLRQLLRTNPPHQTWNNIARWTYGILNRPQFQSWKEVPPVDQRFRDEWLKRVAAVNIKKTGGHSIADPVALLEFLLASREELRQQLGFYKPAITICCGTAEYLPHIFSQEEIGVWSTTSNGTYFASSTVLGTAISYFHPQVHYPANFLYTMLMSTVKEILAGNGS